MSTPLLITGAATSSFAIGFVPALVDSLAGALRQQLKAQERWAAVIVAVFYITWLPMMPLSGWAVDRGYIKEVLFFGLLGCALGFAWLGLANSARSLLTSILVLGVGYSCLATAGIRLMPIALGFGARPSTMAKVNAGFVLVILGAIVAPWLVSALQRRWGYRQGLLYLSLGVVIIAGLVFLVPHDLLPAPPGPTAPAWSEALYDYRLWLIGAVVLLYFAIENCMEVWPQPYLRELRFEGRALTLALLTFWVAFMLARLGFGWLPRTSAAYEPWLLFGLLAVSAFTLGNLVGAGEYSSGSVGVWLTGACYGPLLPGFLALVMDIFDNQPATTLGMMLALSGVDTLIVRPLMTRLANRSSARTLMRVPLVLALIMAGPLLFLVLSR